MYGCPAAMQQRLTREWNGKHPSERLPRKIDTQRLNDRTHRTGKRALAGGCGGSGSAPPMPAVAELVAGTEPERSGGGVRLMLNRLN